MTDDDGQISLRSKLKCKKIEEEQKQKSSTKKRN